MRLYESNTAVLRRQVKDHCYIIPVSEHRNPDGSLNIARFKENWEKHMAEMERIPLWKEGKTPDFDDRDPLQEEPYLVFIPAQTDEIRGTILIAHGGGFEIRTGCEGPNIALAFHDLGYNTAILTYRLRPYTRFHAIADMQRAIKLLRFRRRELGISEKITVMGFSAGGMLSGNCATLYYGAKNAAAVLSETDSLKKEVVMTEKVSGSVTDNIDPVERESDRPDACVMAYGAFTGVSITRPFMMPPFDDLCGRKLEDRFLLAVEKQITPQCPPFFVWQTLSDDGRLGLTLCKALSDAEVPYELHIFDDAQHGVGLADGENDLGINAPHVTHWAELADEFLQKHGVK